MALTRDFKETIHAPVKRDPGFPKTLLREGVENFLSGDSETGNILLRDFIGAGLVEKITTRQIKGPSK